MDRNYNISSLSFSLELLSATKAVGCILNASRTANDIRVNREDFDSDVMDRIKRSGVTPLLRKMLENLAKPMGDELLQWHRQSYTRFRPYWTPQGTVDTVKCVKIILGRKRASRGLRLALACKFCSQKHLDVIYNEILATGDDPKSVPYKYLNVFVSLWAERYLFNDRVQTRSFFNHGFKHAINVFRGNEVAVQYFVDKVSRCEANKHVCRMLNRDINYQLYTPRFSPATYCALYRRLDGIHQKSMADEFATLVLIAHLKWPHQHRFLEAARELIPLLTAEDYFRVLTSFATRVESGYKEWDYRKLYADFWELGNVRRRGESGTSMKTWPLNWPCLVYLLNRDEGIIRFVLSELPIEVKEALLLDFPANELSDVLHVDELYPCLEAYIRCCGMHSEDLLVRLRHTFVSEWRANEGRRLSYANCFDNIHWQLRDWEDAFVRVTEMMDRIIADKRAASCGLSMSPN